MPALKNCSTLLQIKVRLQFASPMCFFPPDVFLLVAISMGMKCDLSGRDVAISLLVLFMFLSVSDVFCMLDNCFA